MKILMTSQYFPPLCTFGAENYAFHLAQDLANRHEVHVISAGHDQGNQRFETESYHSITIHRSYNLKRTHPYHSDEIDNWASSIIDTYQPDILHIHHLAGLSDGIPELAITHSIPIVATLHDYWYLCSNYHLLRGDETLCPYRWETDCAECDQHTNALLDKNALREETASTLANKKQFYKRRLHDLTKVLHQAKLLYAPSRFIKQVYERIGIPEDRIIYSPYGMDHSLFSADKKKNNRAPVFGFIGSLSPHKGVHVLIDAFNQLGDTDASLIIRGAAGVHQQDYEKQLKAACNNPRVRFAGHLPNHEVNQFFSEIDTLIVPSIWYENAPLVISEAFMTHTPVLCGNAGGMAEMVDNEINGLHFAIGDSTDLANKLRLITTEPELQRSFSFPEVRDIISDAQEKENDYKTLLKY